MAVFFWEFPVLVEGRSSILKIAEQKFSQGYTTMDLMALAKSDAQKRRVAIVALLEVDEYERYSGMSKTDIDVVRKCHHLIQEFISLKNLQANALSSGGNAPCRVKS